MNTMLPIFFENRIALFMRKWYIDNDDDKTNNKEVELWTFIPFE